jgi:hypothetical protein
VLEQTAIVTPPGPIDFGELPLRLDKEQGVFGLQLFLGAEGAAKGHDWGDDAIDPFG